MFNTAFTLGILRGLIIAVLLGALAWPVSVFYEEQRLVALICALAMAPIVRGMVSPRMAIFVQRLDFRREVALELFGKAVSVAVAVTLALTTGSYWAIAAGTITTPTVMVAVSYIFAPQRPRLTLAEWPRFADIVGWNSLSQAIGALNWQLDKILLGRFVELPSFGKYVLSDNLAGIPNQAVIFPLMRPLVAAFAPLTNRTALAAAYYKATTAILLVAAPLLVTMALLADPAVRLVLGEKWTEAGPILRWLALCNILTLPVAAMPPLVMAIDRTRFLALRTFTEFAVGLPALLVGVMYFGIFGAIAARAVSAVTAIATVMWVLRRLVGVTAKGQFSACWRPMVALVPMAAFLLYMADLLEKSPVGGMLIAYTVSTAAAGMAIYFGAALLMWALCRCPDGAEAIAMKRLRTAFYLGSFRRFR